MPESDDKAVLIESLRSEIDALRTSSESLIFSFDRIINLALIFLVGGVGVALTKGHFIIMALIPFPVVIILGYLLGLNVEGLSRAGHKRFLEERLNLIIGRVYLEEIYVAPTRQGSRWYGRLGVAMMQLMLGLLLLGLFAVGFIALQGRPPIFWVLYACGVVYSLVNLGSSIAELSTSYERAYEAAKLSEAGKATPPSAQLHEDTGQGLVESDDSGSRPESSDSGSASET